MRGKRSGPPAVEYQWGASILPGGPATNTPPAPPRPSMPATPDPAPHSAAAPAPQQFGPSPQPFAPPAPVAVPSRFGNTPEFGGAAEMPATQRLGRPADFAGPPVAAAQPQYGAPNGFYPGAAPVYGPPTGRRAPVAVWIVLSVVGGLVVLGILAAIAIPVFLSQKQTPANRSVDVPATLLGMPQLHSPQLDGFNAQLATAMNVPGARYENVTSGFFGEGDLPVLFVGAAKLTVRPTQHDEATYLAAAAYGAGITAVSVAPGPYGGKMQCGAAPSTASASAIECYAIDDAGFVLITVFGSSETQAEVLARQVIGAVEH